MPGSTLEFVADFSPAIDTIERWKLDLTNAAREAANAAAEAGVEATVRSMDESFHGGPTRWTRNSMRVGYWKRADGPDHYATIGFRDGASGTPAWKYLSNLVFGNPARRFKRYERRLGATLAAVAPNNRRIMDAIGAGNSSVALGLYTVPARGAQLDQHGNVPVSILNRMLYDVGAHDPMETLFGGNRALYKGAKAFERRNKRKQQKRFFLAKIKGVTAIWERTGHRQIKPFLIIPDDAPSYEPTWDYFATAEDAAYEAFQPAFVEQLRQQIVFRSRT